MPKRMNRYLTTTLPYVNSDPHIGFALELVQADALVRTWRAQGDDVFFNTGTDEHGQKIFEAAKKAGKDVQEYVDHYAGEFQKLKDTLDLDNPTFIRTTDEKHIKAAQKIWSLCAANGDIYQKEYEGLYCVGHEAFVTEKDLVDGKCPDHGTAPQVLKEKNYFFRFSKYQAHLLEYLSRPNAIVPEWRRQEAIAFVKGGLEDFSISREKERLTWGIPVPNDATQVMYVWFDALTSYISTLGWPDDAAGDFKKYWEEGTTLQVAGKDQLRFQSLIWQVMLKSAGLKATDTVFYHGFINSGGKKMSKSLGNVISPYELTEKYGTDATRYILLRHVNPAEDSDVTWERLDEWYTANLTNGLGNLVARIMQLSQSNLETYVPTGEHADLARLAQFEFQGALDGIWSRIQHLDQTITETKPFAVIKAEPERGRQMITALRAELMSIASLLLPFMPATSMKIREAILANKKPENLFPRLGV